MGQNPILTLVECFMDTVTILFIPLLVLKFIYCRLKDLIFNSRREYRDKVELRRPITPTEETMSNPTAASKFALSERSRTRVADQSQCLLFSLPAELRLQIWEELLAGRVMVYEGENGVDEDGRRPGLEKWRAVEPSRKLNKGWALHAEVLRTCRRGMR